MVDTYFQVISNSPMILPFQFKTNLRFSLLSIPIGSIDGRIHIWDVAPPAPPPGVDDKRPNYGPGCTIYPFKTVDAHDGPSRAVAFNPKSAMFVSAGYDLVSD